VLERQTALLDEAVARVDDPAERLAQVPAAYVRAAAIGGRAYPLLWTLQERSDALRATSRAFTSRVLALVTAALPQAGYAECLDLMNAENALGRGYAALLHDGGFGTPPATIEEVAARAAVDGRALVDGHRQRLAR
jgi:hypothetical protein